MDKFGGNGGVVLKTVGDDVCMDFLKPLKTVAALQQFQDGIGFLHVLGCFDVCNL